MIERKCLMTFYPTDCKDNCFNCDCGGAEATRDMYVSINNVQRVCSITGGAADTEEGEYIAEVIRNNLENMVIPAAEVQPVKRGRWKYRGSGSPEFTFRCSCCENIAAAEYSYCPNCGARMDGDTECK